MFNKRLKIARNSKKATQQETADKVGITIRAYQQYEQGTREPALDKLTLLCKFLEVSADYLLGLTD